MNPAHSPTVLLCVLCAFASSALTGSSGCAPKDKPRATRKTPTTRPETAATSGPMSLEEAMALIDRRDAWTEHPPINVPRHPAEKFLAGMTIVLDPGHGGEDGGDASTKPAGYKAGPTGVKEAHVNLRVAKLLQRLLTDAGATVVMTREADETISLRERAEVANRAARPDGALGADLFISVHHNAVGNRETNYTSVWYHGSTDTNEVELDVAKYVAHALGREMRTDVARSSPTFSSHLMYASGFGVLRACRVPAILLECSFYTNPDEEQRLRDAGYNLREAYGVYVGLCEYAYGGRPTQSTPTVTLDGSQLTIATTLDEGLPAWWGSDRSRIVASTVSMTLDGSRLPATFDPATKVLRATVPHEPGEAAAAQFVLSVHHANLFKHHNWPQRYRLTVPASGAGDMTVEPLPPARESYERPATRPTPAPAAAR